MSRRVRVEPEAEAELEAAAGGYERQSAGLGLELLTRVEHAFQRLEAGEHGTAVPGARTDARRIPVPRFPLWVWRTRER